VNRIHVRIHFFASDDRHYDLSNTDLSSWETLYICVYMPPYESIRVKETRNDYLEWTVGFTLYLQTRARNVGVHIYTVSKTFHTNLYDVQHM
jgi:hypothetical protein